jgi:hypothetical protein
MVLQGKFGCLQGVGRDDSTSENLLLRSCERTNCGPACGSSVHRKLLAFRLRCIYLSPVCQTVAVCYSVDGLEVKSRWRRDFPYRPTGAKAHPASCTVNTGSFPGIKRSKRGADQPSHSFQTGSNLNGLSLIL